MQLNELADVPGATKNRMRVGRGIGSGKGKTAGRGMKGQKSRSGHKVNKFEGGQMPIYRRLPKRGFTNYNEIRYAQINLDRLQEAVDAKKFDASKPVTEQVLVESGVLTHKKDGVKILGRGKLSAKLILEVSGASKAATAAIEKAGGKVTILEVKKYAQPSKKNKSKE